MSRMLLLASFCLLSAQASAQRFEAQLSGAQEVPPKQGDGSGKATLTLEGDKLAYQVDYKGLSGPATAGHIHGPAGSGANAGVAIPFASPGDPIKGAATLTPEQVTALKDGKMYVNIHTQQNPGGEIRGQIKAAP